MPPAAAVVMVRASAWPLLTTSGRLVELPGQPLGVARDLRFEGSGQHPPRRLEDDLIQPGGGFLRPGVIIGDYCQHRRVLPRRRPTASEHWSTRKVRRASKRMVDPQVLVTTRNGLQSRGDDQEIAEEDTGTTPAIEGSWRSAGGLESCPERTRRKREREEGGCQLHICHQTSALDIVEIVGEHRRRRPQLRRHYV